MDVDSFALGGGNTAAEMNDRPCNRCTARIPRESNFCPMCGASALPPGSVTPYHVRAAIPPLSPARPPRAPAALGIPVARRPARIALGAIAIAAAALGALWLAAGERADELLVGGSLTFVALGLAGLALVHHGARHRAQAHAQCRRCDRPVVAWKGAFGLHCPHAPHYARVHWFLVAMTALFWVGLAASGAVLGLWLG
jgi:hypothetical protein